MNEEEAVRNDATIRSKEHIRFTSLDRNIPIRSWPVRVEGGNSVVLLPAMGASVHRHGIPSTYHWLSSALGATSAQNSLSHARSPMPARLGPLAWQEHEVERLPELPPRLLCHGRAVPLNHLMQSRQSGFHGSIANAAIGHDTRKQGHLRQVELFATLLHRLNDRV